jgi:4-alpha-glucanotransferase
MDRPNGFNEVLGHERGGLVLLHPTSLPDPPGRAYGVGELGSQAFQFLEFLAETGTLAWQTLPLGHTGFKDSPYQTFSRFAGSPLLISVERLFEAGDLTPEQHDAYCERARALPADRVDYGWLFEHKLGSGPEAQEAVLRQAFDNFSSRAPEDSQVQAFEAFRQSQAHRAGGWLADYSEFMALKERHGQRCWSDWPTPWRNVQEWRHEREALLAQNPDLARGIRFFAWLQFVFFEQWNAIRDFARQKGRILVGDAPWYVGYDSADVWARRFAVFDLDCTGRPLRVAGVPPDAFSATGQLWGNPLYNWHSPDAQQWWVEAMDFMLDMVDVLRLDHFRALDTYWVVSRRWVARKGTAEKGYWQKGPGGRVLKAIQQRLEEKGRIAPGGNLPLVAEDLGCFDSVFPSIRDYPEHTARHQRYSISREFRRMLREGHADVLPVLDRETGRYCTRKGTDVHLEDFRLPRMIVLQFGFEGCQFLWPEEMPYSAITYTATHDNDTSIGWFLNLTEREIGWFRGQKKHEHPPLLAERIRLALLSREERDTVLAARHPHSHHSHHHPHPHPHEGTEGHPEPEPQPPTYENAVEAVLNLLRVAWKTPSCLAGAQMQDLLLLDSSSRMNLPGDAHGQWWAWRMTHEQATQPELTERLKRLNAEFDRWT